MRHLIVCREYPPAAYATGGIGTYVANVSRALARAGEIVHVIGQQWRGAPAAREELMDGRLVVHRVPLDQPFRRGGVESSEADIRVLRHSPVGAQAWSWNATLLAEMLIEREGIDVVEAQEWEGPLHFFLQRRALGRGPSRVPPCIVHLHSPSQLIWEHNDWMPGHPALLPVRRREEYCVATADALLSPSRFLASQLGERYGLATDSITVIPYPMHDRASTSRASGEQRRPRTTGPVLFVGRIERRKGVLEFVDAAVEVAHADRDVAFEFIGSDVRGPSGESTLAAVRRRIPRTLARRFHFAGAVPWTDVPSKFATARFAVVPSRWENFPNSCIEAMSAGVPCLVSPNGGMSEVVEDGVSGWVATTQAPADLAAALRRALLANESELTRLGERAAQVIHEHCGVEHVVRRQLEFRRTVVERGASRSTRLPATLPWAGARMHPDHSDQASSRVHAVNASTVDASMADVSTANVSTADVSGSPGDATPAVASSSQLHDIASARSVGGSVVEVADALAAHGVARDKPDGAVMLLAPGYVAEPDGVEFAIGVLNAHPDVGLVIGWVAQGDSALVPPSPAFPYQWLANELWPVAVVRAHALLAAGAPRPELGDQGAWWDSANAIMALGYKAVTIPARLARLAGDRSVTVAPYTDDEDDGRRRALRRRVQERFPELVARDAAAIAELSSPALGRGAGRTNATDRWVGITPREVWSLPARDKWTLAVALLRDPRRAIGWLRVRLLGGESAS